MRSQVVLKVAEGEVSMFLQINRTLLFLVIVMMSFGGKTAATDSVSSLIIANPSNLNIVAAGVTFDHARLFLLAIDDVNVQESATGKQRIPFLLSVPIVNGNVLYQLMKQHRLVGMEEGLIPCALTPLTSDGRELLLSNGSQLFRFEITRIETVGIDASIAPAGFDFRFVKKYEPSPQTTGIEELFSDEERPGTFYAISEKRVFEFTLDDTRNLFLKGGFEREFPELLGGGAKLGDRFYLGGKGGRLYVTDLLNLVNLEIETRDLSPSRFSELGGVSELSDMIFLKKESEKLAITVGNCSGQFKGCPSPPNIEEGDTTFACINKRAPGISFFTDPLFASPTNPQGLITFKTLGPPRTGLISITNLKCCPFFAPAESPFASGGPAGGDSAGGDSAGGGPAGGDSAGGDSAEPLPAGPTLTEIPSTGVTGVSCPVITSSDTSFPPTIQPLLNLGLSLSAGKLFFNASGGTRMLSQSTFVKIPSVEIIPSIPIKVLRFQFLLTNLQGPETRTDAAGRKTATPGTANVTLNVAALDVAGKNIAFAQQTRSTIFFDSLGNRLSKPILTSGTRLFIPESTMKGFTAVQSDGKTIDFTVDLPLTTKTVTITFTEDSSFTAKEFSAGVCELPVIQTP